MAPSAILAAGLLSVALAAPLRAQDGRLVSQQPFTADDSLVARLRRSAPDHPAVRGRVAMRAVTYLSDGLRIRGFVLAPKAPGRYPVVIFNRGGCKEYGALTRAFAAEWLTPIADWGYVVVASQYRGNGGSEGRDEFGGRDVRDVLHLLPVIDSLPEADPTRIGMWGESRGGVMTYLALRQTTRVRAAVLVSAPSDLSTLVTYRRQFQPTDDFEAFCLRDAVPDYDRDRAGALAARSAVRWAEELNAATPLLLVQGTSDWRSDPRQALDMGAKLLALRRPFRLVMLEGGSHSLIEHLGEVDRLARDWLDRYVRDRRPWPPLEPHGR